MQWRRRPIGLCHFLERKLYCHTLYFSLRIVKFLQLRGCRQIAQPCKYCLVCDYFSLAYNFFSIVASHGFGNFVNIPIKKIPSDFVTFLFSCIVVCCVLSQSSF